MKEEKNAAKAAFNGTAFAQFLSGPGRWEARSVLLSFRIPGNNGDSTLGGMDPVNELRAPIARIQADDAWMDGVEAHSEASSKRGRAKGAS